MAGGPILPSSIYVGGAGGNLTLTAYIPSTNTNTAGAIEGVGCIASLNVGGVDAPLVLQFNLPEVLPSGTAKLRALAWANATSGNALYTPTDGQTAVNANIGGTSLSGPGQQTVTWTTVDIMMEKKTNISSTPLVINNMLTVLVTFNNSSWTLAQTSVWQFSLVWE